MATLIDPRLVSPAAQVRTVTVIDCGILDVAVLFANGPKGLYLPAIGGGERVEVCWSPIGVRDILIRDGVIIGTAADIAGDPTHAAFWGSTSGTRWSSALPSAIGHAEYEYPQSVIYAAAIGDAQSGAVHPVLYVYPAVAVPVVI